MSVSFTLLHLSDLHFGPHCRFRGQEMKRLAEAVAQAVRDASSMASAPRWSLRESTRWRMTTRASCASPSGAVECSSITHGRSSEEAMGPTAFGIGDIPACGIYGYADAYLSYNSAYINAEASVNISGPVQPGLALAWAWAESGASGVHEKLSRRGLAIDGTARLYAYASAGPDFCYRGGSEAMVSPSNCPNDYVSHYREFSTDWCSFPP